MPAGLDVIPHWNDLATVIDKRVSGQWLPRHRRSLFQNSSESRMKTGIKNPNNMPSPFGKCLHLEDLLRDKDQYVHD
jgi:hypothetical protein